MTDSSFKIMNPEWREVQMTFLVLLKESQNRYMDSSMIVNNHRESGIKYELLINRNTCIGVNISERKSGTKRTKNRTARNKNKKASFSMFRHQQRAQLAHYIVRSLHRVSPI